MQPRAAFAHIFLGQETLKELPVSPGLWSGDELETKSLCFGPEFGLLAFFVPELCSGKSAVIELLFGGDEVKDNPG
jgi:hypothetical protein